MSSPGAHRSEVTLFRGRFGFFLQLIIFKNKMLFPRIILEARGVKSNYFGEDLISLCKLLDKI